MYGSLLSHSDAPSPLHSSRAAIFFFTNSPRRPELPALEEGRCSVEPLGCCRSWSPRPPPMPGSLAFLNVTVAPGGDISDQPLQSAVPSLARRMQMGTEVVAAVEEPALALSLLQATGLGLWPGDKCRATVLFWAICIARRCPCAGYHIPWCLPPCLPKQLCASSVKRRMVCCLGTRNMLVPDVVSASTKEILVLGSGAFASLLCLKTPE